jgi:hypothetical protein
VAVLTRRALVAVVAVSLPAIRQAHADEPAVFVLRVPSPTGEVTDRLNRELPAGVPIKLQIPVPGADPVSGSLVVWPLLDGASCKPDSLPTDDARQRHDLGLVTSGASDARVLEATIPALQLATRYCLRVIYDQRLPVEVVTAIATGIGAHIEWSAVCADADRDARLIELFQRNLAEQLARYAIATSPASLGQAAATIERLFDLRAHCDQLNPARERRDRLASEDRTARARITRIKRDVLCLPTTDPEAGPSPTCARPPASSRSCGAPIPRSTHGSTL